VVTDPNLSVAARDDASLPDLDVVLNPYGPAQTAYQQGVALDDHRIPQVHALRVDDLHIVFDE
jgi:hypothetical protein